MNKKEDVNKIEDLNSKLLSIPSPPLRPQHQQSAFCRTHREGLFTESDCFALGIMEDNLIEIRGFFFSKAAAGGAAAAATITTTTTTTTTSLHGNFLQLRSSHEYIQLLRDLEMRVKCPHNPNSLLQLPGYSTVDLILGNEKVGGGMQGTPKVYIGATYNNPSPHG